MRKFTLLGAGTLAALLATATLRTMFQTPPVRTVDEAVLREYTGVYQWAPDAFVYLQLWHEFTGFDKPPQLVAFDESGEIRVLFPTDRDRFFTGPGIALSSSVESRVEFQRDGAGKIVSFARVRGDAPPRTARRVDIETREDVRFSNGAIQLAGTLRAPARPGRHPAIILVHGSGAENRDYILPFARWLVRRGIAVLGYDKRGVGGSSGDWKSAPFEELAGDVLAAFEYLKTRSEIDAAQVGLLGVSQAGWVMPIAAVRAPELAFLVSISGGGIVPAETALDNARSEMMDAGMRTEVIDRILDLMRLQHRFARTGEGWDEYMDARKQLAARFGGAPPPSFPGTRDDSLWTTMRAFYFYDPAPTLGRLKTPTLALFGERDRNIVPERNVPAWEAGLKAAGNPDYAIRVLPKANHLQWEARTGSGGEMASLNGFVPEYLPTIEDWLAKRIRGFKADRSARTPPK